MRLLPLRLKRVAMSQTRERAERHVERMGSISERGVDHIESMNGPEILDSVDQIEKLDKVARRTFGLNDAQTEIPQTLVNVAILNL
jgi:hypothetical protein